MGDNSKCSAQLEVPPILYLLTPLEWSSALPWRIDGIYMDPTGNLDNPCKRESENSDP